MKIVAFSDWRTQPLEFLDSIIEECNPDAIIYAGDDIGRLIPPSPSILLKSRRHVIELSYPNLQLINDSDSANIAENTLPCIKSYMGQYDFFIKHKLPFYYVNGNDDMILKYKNSMFTRFHEPEFEIDGIMHYLAEDVKKRLCLIDDSPVYDPGMSDLFEMFKSNQSRRLNLITEGEYRLWGLFAPINPHFGNFEIKENGGHDITAFGFQCTFGLESDILNFPSRRADIFISHVPPYGTLDLAKRFGVKHIGSKRLLRIVEKYQPKIVICGHCHLWGGNLRRIGNTTILNISSHDNDDSPANYAIIDTKDWSISLKSKSETTFYQIPGIRALFNTVYENPKLLPKKCIDFPPTKQEDLLFFIRQLEKKGVNVGIIKKRIQSLYWKKPQIFKPLTFNPLNQAFVDVETGAFSGNTPGKLWLIGLLYKNQIKQFLFPKGMKSFLSFLRDNEIRSLASWTNYDGKSLRPILTRNNINITFIDARSRVRNCVNWHTFKLHELHSAFFKKGGLPKEAISGFEAGIYADHIILSKTLCPFCPPKQDVIDKIIKRNKLDLFQMKEICKKVWGHK